MLDSLVLLLHLRNLEVLCLGGNEAVDGDEEDHGEEAGKDARSELKPQEVDRAEDLERGAPHHVNVRLKRN